MRMPMLHSCSYPGCDTPHFEHVLPRARGGCARQDAGRADGRWASVRRAAVRGARRGSKPWPERRLAASREQKPDSRTGEQELRLDGHPAPWRPPPRWKSFWPPSRSHGTRCSRSGMDAAAPPSTAGSSGPRQAASRPSATRPLPISKLRSGMSSCGTWSPAMCSGRAEQKRERTRADDGSHRRAGRHVQRDDHAPIIAYARRDGSRRPDTAAVLLVRRGARHDGQRRGGFRRGDHGGASGAGGPAKSQKRPTTSTRATDPARAPAS